MKKEYVKKGFKKVFGAAAKEAARQALWLVPTLGVLSLIAGKCYELEDEEAKKASEDQATQKEAPVEEHTNEEPSTEEATDEVQVTGQCGDENLKNYESSLEEE